jgi:hypothetical protein
LPLSQFTLDQAAKNDFPAAIAFIRDHTRADSVQAVVHCAGASAFFMALAARYLPDVRCVSCSQIALHYAAPPTTEIKCMLNLSDVFADLGVDYLSATEDPRHPLFQQMFGRWSTSPTTNAAAPYAIALPLCTAISTAMSGSTPQLTIG